MGHTHADKAQALEPLFHAPTRLQIAAYLSEVREAEFSALRDHLSISDSVLSKQLSQLEKAGFISLRKAAKMGRSRKWVFLTISGRARFQAHVKALQYMIKMSAAAAAE